MPGVIRSSAKGDNTVVVTDPLLVTENALSEPSVNGIDVNGSSSCVCPAVIADMLVPSPCVTGNGCVGGVKLPV